MQREVMMLTRDILVVVPVPDEALRRIAAVDGCLHVVDARGWFDVELRDTWPAWTVQRYVGDRSGPTSSRQERDHLLASAEIILGGFPFPLDLRARAPRLRWFHQLPDRKSTRLNSSHTVISYAVFCLKKKKIKKNTFTGSHTSTQYQPAEKRNTQSCRTHEKTT